VAPKKQRAPEERHPSESPQAPFYRDNVLGRFLWGIGAREPARAKGQARVWRGSTFWFGVFHLVAAVVLYGIAAPEAIGFAGLVVAYLVLAGAAMLMVGAWRAVRPSPPQPARFDQLHPVTFFFDTWRDIDEEARLDRVARTKLGLRWDSRPLIALVVGAVCLSLMEYFGGSRTFQGLVAAGDESILGAVFGDLRGSMFLGLYHFVWWGGWRVLGYFLLPAVVIVLCRERIRDQGLETKGFLEHAWIYAFGYYVVFICVVIVSYTHEFSTYYPFYREDRYFGAPPGGAERSWFDFGAWELLYAAQFFSLEFFFRGWWLKSFKSSMGSAAIFAMVVPYCMIHYGKPFPETMGAILAGLFLGTLAMKTRSIWSGFLIHVSIAISMDVAALLQSSRLPNTFWPVS
jgi:membrane protease YdiL (CAAX protease family)